MKFPNWSPRTHPENLLLTAFLNSIVGNPMFPFAEAKILKYTLTSKYMSLQRFKMVAETAHLKVKNCKVS